ncbi:Nose resistant-to-fluoxetine protein, N-terminal,Double-stranded RNA-binding [Cinara cedri]|uniref:Nose resistant-to-fluoxetine protein, N-terminal,Double-stranded RNA-binding n=1 Tax=Cinara cedri TaxID=506608 RepID=A0A5E4M1A7_9HEMI|nr:Nose resistant-to-fluoxetine protein, N-terminal,Double-stranded RNA-binding [Cinara cedri]
MNVLAIIFIATAVITVFGQLNFQSKLWVTKILSNTLDEYTPDGGIICRRHGLEYRDGLKNLKLWATQMYDSSSKFPTGILVGRSFDFGNFDECLKTTTIGLEFKPQYCIINVRFSPTTKLYPNYYNITPSNLNPTDSVWEATKYDSSPMKIQHNEINTALCVPSSCTHSDLQTTLSPKITSMFHNYQLNATVTVNAAYCTMQQELKPTKLMGYQIFWGVLLLIMSITLIGSLYDIYTKEENRSGHKSFFITFSFPANVKRLFVSSNKTENLSCIDILKTHACVLVIVGQRMMYTAGQPLKNSKKVEEVALHLLYAMIRNGSLVVDFFFVISGFLTFHFLYDELVNTKRINVPLLLLWRWLRLMPVYGLMIAFHAFVLLHLADGPLWKSIAFQESYNCRQYWWSNLLFINNYVNANRPCIIQSWYLACDMQFFVAGIILVFFVWKYQKYGVYLMWITIFVSGLIPALIVYAHQFYPTFMDSISMLNYLPDHQSYTVLYVPSHTRSTPYFVGIFAAYVYRYLKLDMPKFRFPYSKTLLTILITVYPLVLMTIYVFYIREYDLWLSVIYTFMFRTVFSTIVSMFIIICAINGFFKGLWLRVFIPLSKLTYGAYLGGLSMQLLQVASMRAPTYFNDSLLLEDHMQLARHDLKKKQTENWVNVTNQSKQSSQSELYEAEKYQIFTYINNFITKLSIEKERLNNSKLSNDQIKSKVIWMEKSIESAITRYNEIGRFLKLPIEDLYPEIKTKKEPLQLNYISKQRRQTIEWDQKFKESQLIITDLRSPMEILINRIVDHGITPTYRFLTKISIPEQQFIYNYSCSLFGMYVEGSSTSKSKAKENTAIEMLNAILKKQKTRSLSTHIRPFNEKEQKFIGQLIKSKANYVNVLESLCIKNMYPPPVYTLLSGKYNDLKLENHYSIQCDAMDCVAIGHSNRKSTAKQISAQNIINLWEKNMYSNNKSSNQSELLKK